MIHRKDAQGRNRRTEISPFPAEWPRLRVLPRNTRFMPIVAVEIYTDVVLVEVIEVDEAFDWPAELVQRFNRQNVGTSNYAVMVVSATLAKKIKREAGL